MNKGSFNKQSIFELNSRLYLTIDWEKNAKQLSELIKVYYPFVELAACWSNPNDFNFFTKNSESIFGDYLKSVKRGDMIQSKEMIPLEIENIPNVHAVSVNLEDFYLGMLVVQLKEKADVEMVKGLLKAIIPQLSLSKYASMMSSEVEKRTSKNKLTGLWDRTYFNERFRDEFDRITLAKEHGTIAVLAFDKLAGMAKVLTSEEHTKLLIEASNIVRHMVRNNDWVVHWDKYEILFYLTNTQQDSTVDIMIRCTNALLKHHPLLQPVVGICATFEAKAARSLIQLGARRLDLARKDGRNMIACYSANREGLKFIPLENNADKDEKNTKKKTRARKKKTKETVSE